MKCLVLDTETTGFVEPELIEVAWLEMKSPTQAVGFFEQRYRPNKSISFGAMATHHIMDEDLADCPPSSDFALPPDVGYLIGHNVDFDWGVIGSPDVKRICTVALCRELYPEVDSHSLSAMFYYLERETARERLKSAHSAMADVYLCRDILKHIIAKLGVNTWGDLWRASESARIPKVMPFGKHKGMAIKDIPADYKQWLLRQSDIDPYLIAAISGKS